jgi:vacuolar-type H+-ATPase subunit E/Vma4
MNRLELSLADLQRRNTRLLDAYLGGAMELDTYKGRKESLDSAIQQTRSRLEELQNQHAQENSAAMLQSGIRQALNTLTDPTATLVDKNNAIRSVTDKIVWNKAEKTLDITYRIIF